MGGQWRATFVVRPATKPVKAAEDQANESSGSEPRREGKLTSVTPQELLLMILGGIENQRDLYAAALTCRKLFDLARPLLVWKNAQGQREALHWACVHGHVETLKEVLAAEAHTNPFNLWVLTRKFSTPIRYFPLDEARCKSRTSLLPDVREPKLDESFSHAIQDIRTPLHIAAAWHHVEIVRTLIEHGVSPLYRPKDRRVPSRIRRGKYYTFDAIDWVMTLNPLVPDKHLPTELAKVKEIMRILLKDLTILRNDYLTYICDQWLNGKWNKSRAKRRYMIEVIKTLIDMGANPRAAVVKPKRSYLRLCKLKERISIVDNLLYHNHLDTANTLQLLFALMEGDDDFNPISKVGVSLLHTAVMDRNTVLIDYLLKRGADPNTTLHVSGVTPLHLLTSKHTHRRGGRVGIAKTLILAGASLEQRDKVDDLLPIDRCIRDELWGMAALLMLVGVAKRFMDQHVFQEERAWTDPEWLKIVRMVVDEGGWFDKPWQCR